MSTRQIAETEKAIGMPKNKVAARKGGGIAKKRGQAGGVGSNFLPPRKKGLKN